MITQHLITPFTALHSTNDAGYIKTDLTQCPSKQAILLITPATTSTGNDFVEDALNILVK